jgi:hypothetical protein
MIGLRVHIKSGCTNLMIKQLHKNWTLSTTDIPISGRMHAQWNRHRDPMRQIISLFVAGTNES